MTLRLTLEIVPFGNEDEKYTIETVNISNIGKDPEDDSGEFYEYIIEHNEYKKFKRPLTMVSFRRKAGALKLAQLALEELNDKQAIEP